MAVLDWDDGKRREIDARSRRCRTDTRFRPDEDRRDQPVMSGLNGSQQSILIYWMHDRRDDRPDTSRRGDQLLVTRAVALLIYACCDWAFCRHSAMYLLHGDCFIHRF